MNNTRHTNHAQILAATICGFCLFAGAVKAATVVNGDLTGVPGISTTPPNWTASTESPDLTSPGGITDSGFIYANSAPASPNGGTFVIVEASTAAVEGFSQTITGLTPGASYKITFFQSQVALTTTGAPLTALFTDPSQWSVSFSGTTILSPLESFTGLGTQTWTPVSLAGFTAGSDSEVLEFTSVLPVGSTQAYLGIDGIEVQQIPDPSSLALLAFTSLGLVSRRLRNRK